MFETKALMTTNVISVKKQTPITEVIEVLVAHDITGLPVVDDEMTLMGVISEKDLLSLLTDSPDDSATAEDFMTKEVVCFDREDSIIDLTDCFVKNHFRRVPILAGGKLVGIVSKKDIIAYILEMRKMGEMKMALRAIYKKQKWP